MRSMLLLLPLPLLACGPKQTSLPAAVTLDAGDSVRLLLVGDSGTVGQAADGCDPDSEASPIQTPCREVLWASMAAENADATVALGDLVYEIGPECPAGELTEDARTELTTLLGDMQVAVGNPLLMAIGNHDVGGSVTGREAAENCYRRYAAETDGVEFPERQFLVSAGPITLAILDTNRELDRDLAAEIAAEVRTRATPWTMFAAHHVWRTFGDKEGQDHGRRWSDAIGVTPDFWLNGHAHFLQMGIYDGVRAVTSGSAAKLRNTEACGGAGPACGHDGLLFSAKRYGYAE